MYLMGETYRIYNVAEGVVKPYSMSYISQRRFKFIKALNVASIHWTRNDVIEVMEKLIQSKYSYVSYGSLCKTVCQQTVDSLIEQNIIHLRPCGKFPFDVEMVVPSEYPIITPHLPCDLMLMAELLENQKH